MIHLAPYAALLALLFVALSWRTIGLRRRYCVAVGDGGQPELLRAMRVHANFAEYVPLALLLIGAGGNRRLARLAGAWPGPGPVGGPLRHAWG